MDACRLIPNPGNVHEDRFTTKDVHRLRLTPIYVHRRSFNYMDVYEDRVTSTNTHKIRHIHKGFLGLLLRMSIGLGFSQGHLTTGVRSIFRVGSCFPINYLAKLIRHESSSMRFSGCWDRYRFHRASVTSVQYITPACKAIIRRTNTPST